MRDLLRVALVVVLTFFATIILSPTASAGNGGCGRLRVCQSTGDGIDTGMSRDSVIGLPKAPGDDGKSALDVAYTGPRYEYGWSTACGMNQPGSPAADSMCMGAVTACSDPAGGPGPMSRIWRRTIQDGQPPSEWALVGTTCWADVVPGSRPTVTMAMIQNAFNLTPWAKPQITTQPKGDVTLVGLDTYYKVNWTPAGFQPEEIDAIDPARMNGYQVDVRVKLDHFVWQFGDGQSFGPTNSEGGVYPSGNITHQYLAGGGYPASVNTTFAGDFRINGGAWAPIPNMVTVPGPPTTVTVKTAQAQLVDH